MTNTETDHSITAGELLRRIGSDLGKFTKETVRFSLFLVCIISMVVIFYWVSDLPLNLETVRGHLFAHVAIGSALVIVFLAIVVRTRLIQLLWGMRRGSYTIFYMQTKNDKGEPEITPVHATVGGEISSSDLDYLKSNNSGNCKYFAYKCESGYFKRTPLFGTIDGQPVRFGLKQK